MTDPTRVISLNETAPTLRASLLDRTGALREGIWVVDLPTGVAATGTLEPVLSAVESGGTAVIRLHIDPARPRHALHSLVTHAARIAEGAGQPLPLPPLVTAATVESDLAVPALELTAWRETVFNLREGIRTLVAAATAHRPVAIVTTGIQSADEDTFGALEHLALSTARSGDGTGGRANVALVFVVHDGERCPTATRLFGLPGAERFRFEGVGRDGMLAWLTQSPSLDRLIELSGGVPERLAALVEQLPGLLELQRRHRKPTSPDALRIAALVALAELPIGIGEIGRALDLDEFTVRRISGALVQSGTLDTLDGRRLRVPPEHADALHTSLDPESTKALHSKLADIFADRWSFEGDDSGVEAATRHWLAAGEATRAVRFGLRAGEHLQSRLALYRTHALYTLLWRAASGEDRTRVELRLAEVCVAVGRNDDAVDVLQGLEMRESTMVPSRAATVGRLYLATGRLDHAIRLLEVACTAAENDPELRAEVSLRLAQAYYERGDLERALHHCQQRHAVPAELRVTEGNVRFRQGRLDAARTAYQEAAAVARNPLVRSRALHNVGLVALRQGRYAEAVHSLQQSLVACEQAGEYYGAALCHFNLGVAYEHMDRLALAERSESFAADVFARLGHLHMQASALSTLGDLALQLGDPRQAHRLLQRALKIAESAGSTYEATYAKLKLAKIALAQGRIGTAEAMLRDATEGLTSGGNTDDLAWAALYAAELAIAQGNAVALADAEAHLDRLTVRGTHEVHAQMALALARWEEARGNWAEAATHARDARQRAARLPRRRLQLEAMVILLRIVHQCPEAVARVTGDGPGVLRDEAHQMYASLLADVPETFRVRYSQQAALAIPGAATTEATPSEALPPPGNERIASSLHGAMDHVAVGPVHPALPRVLGQSESMRLVGEWISRVAKSPATVLLTGESGTGKELVAEAIHLQSGRAEGPFVRVNVAALPETLLESELFGHERGSFTGALGRRKGKFELAHGGTLFLDEIGDISPGTQVRLLRVLQDQSFERVGGTDTVRVNVRVVCATNRDLEEMVARGSFRLDLYHRVRGVTLTLPALRDRGLDALHLARHFLRELGLRDGRIVEWSPEAERLLAHYAWPGNVRELENVVRTAYVLCPEDVIGVESLQLHDTPRMAISQVPWDGPKDSTLPALDEAKRDLEVKLIVEALRRTDGNITRAAELLGMKRPRLSQKVREYGLTVPGRDDE